MDFSFLQRYYPMYITGTLNTLALAFFTLLLGVVFGILLALMRLSKSRILKGFASSYIEFIRGTPLLVQLYIVYYGLPQITGMRFPSFFAGIIALTINSSAYIAEIIRAGILSVDAGQMEAVRSLGMSHALSMRYIIIPQAFKNILPALGNEFVVVVKESAIVSIIGIYDIMYSGNIIRGNTYRPFEPLIIVAIIYFIITFTLSNLVGIAERRMRISD
ncbi:amino acid ABC transporter permease [Isachenkonia alkalipeptolytica]|uniref:Amino acid ABC transporter permease n=1 Tax=Isachenkonia alkalipeptolytica TaxID=2565777 RepID=A0AA44BEX2_9CLOT|nr:amino acid ABC transporter permease [Isachenkonia alkalipeptolytica]NBG88605.1 amino acid ABC transporter permease [Isachenkonia alkalipeptolytica]